MLFRKWSLLGVVLGTILLLGAGLAQAAEFSATMITKAGGQEIPGKVYVGGDKVRNEIQAAGHPIINIMRPTEDGLDHHAPTKGLHGDAHHPGNPTKNDDFNRAAKS